MNKSHQEVIAEFIQLLDQKNLIGSIQKIILYGSRARGDHSPQSDIDLAFIAPTLTERNWYKIIDLLDNLNTLLKIQVVNFDKISQSLQERILKEGEVYYEKNQN